jgi:hypothetical protein
MPFPTLPDPLSRALASHGYTEPTVEIASWAATRFTDAARHQEADDEDIRIEPMHGPSIPHGRGGTRHTRAAALRR